MTEHITISRELLRQVLDALTESADLVRHDYESNWRHGIQTRARQLASMKEQLDQHEASIASLRAALEQPAVEPSAVFYRCNHCWRGYEDQPPSSCDCSTGYGFERVEYFTAPQAQQPAVGHVSELVDYILQDDTHNRLTPRVVDIAYSAFMIAKQGKNKDDGGPCDWFNDTRPMVMNQLAKIKKDLAEKAAPVRESAPQAIESVLTNASAQQPRVGPGMSVEQTLEQWEHDFSNPMTPEQQADWVKREREFASRQAQQPRKAVKLTKEQLLDIFAGEKPSLRDVTLCRAVEQAVWEKLGVTE